MRANIEIYGASMKNNSFLEWSICNMKTRDCSSSSAVNQGATASAAIDLR